MNKISKKKLKPQNEKKRTHHTLTLMKYIRAFNVFGNINRDTVISLLPFMLFLVLLGMLQIANSYYTESIVREIDKTSKEIKELHTEFITGRSELMYNTNQSQVAAMVEPMGLKESRKAPGKIIVPSSGKRKARND
jgi:hypothetical protein